MSSSVRVSDAVRSRLVNLTETHRYGSVDKLLDAMCDLSEGKIRALGANVNRNSPPSSQDEEEDDGAKRAVVQLLSYDALSVCDETMTYITGVRKGAWDWVFPKLIQVVCSFVHFSCSSTSDFICLKPHLQCEPHRWRTYLKRNNEENVVCQGQRKSVRTRIVCCCTSSVHGGSGHFVC